MKRFGIGLMIVGLAGVLSMIATGGDSEIYVDRQPFDSQSLNNTNAVCTAYSLRKTYKPDGVFSLQIQVTGTGTIAYVQCEVSNNGTDFVPAVMSVPDAANDAVILTNRIFESYTATSGPNSDGNDHIQIGIPLCVDVRWRVYGTNGTSTNSMWFALQ